MPIFQSLKYKGENMTIQTPESYSMTKTLVKGGSPLAVVVVVELIDVALQQAGIAVAKDHLYQGAIAIYSGAVGLINWIKNRRKK
jgi:hypothetical protein